MTDTRTTWGTVSTVLEPPQILLAFAAYHLHAGASEVHLYLDAPCPDAERWLAQKPRVTVTICDAAYWQSEHGRTRPTDSRERQVLNARHAYARTNCDWLAHIDADEFLIRVPQIVRFLADCSPQIKVVSLHNAERVLRRGQIPRTVFDGLFRKPFPTKNSAAERKIYGEGADFLLRGFSGYAIGKSLYRVGAGLKLDLHEPAPTDYWRGPTPERVWFPRMGLLHVDGYTRAHWEDKLRKKTRLLRQDTPSGHNPARTRQIAHFLEEPDGDVDTDRLYDMTRCLSYRQLAQMLLHRKLLPETLSLRAALKAEFPEATVDLSPEAIDAALADIRHRSQ
ncbi:glycosyltransferase family 2 protein [Pacificoceanicola onchidii]|uniref:glycosyltransferase family 2 protein n=1 Tax=Pacificoceanicola onchidii TaxID=2562685 RepID=UPI0010A64269|nr:glycosyltransferase family 2 protein [Pacificoceanicola onchidii]